VAADRGARLVPKTLFGQKSAELAPPRPGGPRLRSGALIPRSRTAPATEIQQVLDRAVPVLSAIDAQRFSATLASLASALDGTGRDISRLTEGATTVFDELAARQEELAVLFRHTPGLAATVADRSDDLDTAAERMGAVADVLATNEPALARFLAENAELAGQASDLLRAENGRVNRIIPDMLTVLDVITAQPGKIAELARAAPVFTEGLAAVTKTGSFRSPIAYMVGLGIPGRLEAKGPLGEAEGGAGIGPDIYVHGLEIPDVVIGGPQTQQSGLAALLATLAGGGQ
jgi:phospholipid/cholesterol/gamma-HCH transport system substrate-binding protein